MTDQTFNLDRFRVTGSYSLGGDDMYVSIKDTASPLWIAWANVLWGRQCFEGRLMGPEGVRMIYDELPPTNAAPAEVGSLILSAQLAAFQAEITGVGQDS